MKAPGLAIRPVVSDIGPDPLALQVNFTKMENNGASKAFIKREKYSTCGQSHGGLGVRVTESHPRGSLNYFDGISLPGIL